MVIKKVINFQINSTHNSIFGVHEKMMEIETVYDNEGKNASWASQFAAQLAAELIFISNCQLWSAVFPKSHKPHKPLAIDGQIETNKLQGV